MICFNQRGPNRPKRQQDSGWSYLVCACAFVCQAGNMGLILSFGVLFPVIMERFNSKRQDIGNIILNHCDFIVKIPINIESMNSINVSCASTIAFYEFSSLKDF